jgi:hypothetical protein
MIVESAERRHTAASGVPGSAEWIGWQWRPPRFACRARPRNSVDRVEQPCHERGVSWQILQAVARQDTCRWDVVVLSGRQA